MKTNILILTLLISAISMSPIWANKILVRNESDEALLLMLTPVDNDGTSWEPYNGINIKVDVPPHTGMAFPKNQLQTNRKGETRNFPDNIFIYNIEVHVFTGMLRYKASRPKRGYKTLLTISALPREEVFPLNKEKTLPPELDWEHDNITFIYHGNKKYDIVFPEHNPYKEHTKEKDFILIGGINFALSSTSRWIQ